MHYTATAKVKAKIEVSASVRKKVVVNVTYPVLTASCPQYNLIDGGTPSWNYVPIGSFDLISGGNP